MNHPERKLPGCGCSDISERERRHAAIARRAAAEGIVLLENDGVLPLKAGSKLALYGLGARYTVKGGTGSGSVNNRYNISIEQGLLNAGLEITSKAWLDDLDRRQAEAREKWMQEIYAKSTPGDPESLQKEFYSHRMPAVEGGAISGGDCDTAVYVISRNAGEGADRKYEKGDYLISDAETRDLDNIAKAYRNVIVVMNVGGVTDLSFMDRVRVSALIMLSQPGMEGGNALADVMTGKTPFSGRLTDSWPMHYEDIPDSMHFSHNDGNVIREYYKEDIYVGYRYFDSFGVKPRYPFGYGLSLTTFEEKVEQVRAENGELKAEVTIRNTGSRNGRQVVQLYASCPAGLRKKEMKRLIGFAKTAELAPGAKETLTVTVPLRLLASYHTGQASWYLDRGAYTVLLSTDGIRLQAVAALQLQETVFLHETGNILPLQDALKTLVPDEKKEEAWEKAFAEEVRERQLPVLPLEKQLDGIRGQLIPQVIPKDETDREAEKIVSELSDEQKAALCVGRIKSGPAEYIGNAGVQVPGAAGETASVLEEKYGIRGAIMADGPAGLRLQQHFQCDPETGKLWEPDRYSQMESWFFGKEFRQDKNIDRYQFASAVPVGTLLAQTFNVDTVREVGELIGDEMQELGVEIWLAPGMNIHRNPLCGRNFEYYSEDPLIAGRMAAAVTKGVQSRKNCIVTIKHFACNNQEENRRGVSSVVSERALREIYLLGFELAVREAQPGAIMTSYNKINGVHTANSRDLCDVTARGQWGFRGIIMTDWTTTNFDGGASAAKCVAAGNDITMPGLLSDIREILDAVHRTGDQSLEKKQLNASAERVVACALRLGCRE